MARWIFYRSQTGRSRVIGQAVKEGLGTLGVEIAEKHESEYQGVEADVAVFYGLWGNLRQIQMDYSAQAHAVLIDLGYWGRLDGGKMAGYHRFAVNGRHATAYFQRMKHPSDRFDRFGIQPKPFRRKGRHVLLAGMSGKSAWVYGLAPEQWERETIAQLRARTAREIWYRPKPSKGWTDYTPLQGAVLADWKVFIDQVLEGCWAVVTHHGNTALDALIAGVPAFCCDGLGTVLCSADLAEIECPVFPGEAMRDQLLFDAAYTQWKVNEIEQGLPFRQLIEEGIL